PWLPSLYGSQLAKPEAMMVAAHSLDLLSGIRPDFFPIALRIPRSASPTRPAAAVAGSGTVLGGPTGTWGMMVSGGKGMGLAVGGFPGFPWSAGLMTVGVVRRVQ